MLRILFKNSVESRVKTENEQKKYTKNTGHEKKKFGSSIASSVHMFSITINKNLIFDETETKQKKMEN